MYQLPTDFRPAFDRDIIASSHGEITARRSSFAEWRKRKGTLDDDSIFGPKTDYTCFCGKFSGREFAGLICLICGATIQTSEARGSRFADIWLKSPILHPFDNIASDLWTIPVLPARIRERHPELDVIYEELVDARGLATQARSQFDALIAKVLPFFEAATDKREKIILGRGIGLTPRQPGPPRRMPQALMRICSRCHSRDPFYRKSKAPSTAQPEF